MFSDFFSPSVPETVRINLFKDVYAKRTGKVIAATEDYTNLNRREFIDEKTNENLLHISTKTRNRDLIIYFKNKDVSTDKINIFGETPLDIAIKNHDTESIKILLKSSEPNFKEELEIEKTQHKRKREECEELQTQVKQLKADNQELQKTVKSLRESFKKK